MLFGESLQAKGLIINEGKMIDASFAPVPIQRNTPEENKKIKDGEGGDLWNDNPNKKKHKDIDARWTKKGGKSYFGYKNHAKVDVKSKLIDKWAVTDASVHDSQALDMLLEESDKVLINKKERKFQKNVKIVATYSKKITIIVAQNGCTERGKGFFCSVKSKKNQISEPTVTNLK